jgi:hypothetical protein
MKKTFVLVVLFILPIVAYLFFATGVNNFGKLPVLNEKLNDLEVFDTTTNLNGQITILGFLGNNVDLRKTNVLNLNQKIYKRFSEFSDFQMVMVVPTGNETIVDEIKTELQKLTDISKWEFIFADGDSIKTYFERMRIPVKLEDDLGTDLVFIVDKERKLRGRDDDEDEGVKYGFNATSVAEINNKMVDDVKIVLAEYRLALKKNNATRSK